MSLYEKLGGQAAITKAVEIFYQKVLSDETVNQFFKDTDMDRQRDHQAKFLTFALGGPNNYTGRNMAKAHEGMNIQPEHFNAIATHLASTLQELNVPQDDIDVVINKVGSLADDIMYK